MRLPNAISPILVYYGYLSENEFKSKRLRHQTVLAIQNSVRFHKNYRTIVKRINRIYPIDPDVLLPVKDFYDANKSSTFFCKAVSINKIFRSDTVETPINDMNALCQNYKKLVEKVEVVKNVFVIKKDDNEIFLWTVIEAPPFDSSLTKPIYTAISTLYRRITDKILLDFDVINLSEFRGNQKLENIIPDNALAIYP
jgi:hypothetical protein